MELPSGRSSSGPQGPPRSTDTVPDLEGVRSRYRRDGFCFPFRGLAEDEAARTLAAYERFRNTLLRSPLGAAGLVFKPHLLATWAHALARQPGILDVVEAVIGPDILVWSMDLFVRPPIADLGRGTDQTVAPLGLLWHQDAPEMGLTPLDGVVRAWIALTPTTVANGTMHLVPGSHLRGEQPHAPVPGTDPDVQGRQVVMDVDPRTAVPVELEPGQFSVHGMCTVHGSGANHTSATRVCVAVTYVSPTVHPGSRPDSALPVRGADTTGNFARETPPAGDFSPEAVASFAEAVALRAQRYGVS